MYVHWSYICMLLYCWYSDIKKDILKILRISWGKNNKCFSWNPIPDTGFASWDTLCSWHKKLDLHYPIQLWRMYQEEHMKSQVSVPWRLPLGPDHMTVIQTMIIYIGCGSNMCNLIWQTCRPSGVPIENQRGQGGGLRLFWNRVIKTTLGLGPVTFTVPPASTDAVSPSHIFHSITFMSLGWRDTSTFYNSTIPSTINNCTIAGKPYEFTHLLFNQLR